MLRGTPDHPKFVALQAALRLPKAHVVGLLELLWHFAAAYAPAGDVGRWPDAAIEGGCGWDGEPGAFIAALVACRWLDSDSSHRLVVHDWHEHTDRYVKRRLARRGGAFAGARREPGGHPTGGPSVPVPVPEPEPEPEPVPVPVPVQVPTSGGQAVGQKNPLLDREHAVSEAHRLTTLIAEHEDRDPTEVAIDANTYQRNGSTIRGKPRYDTLGDDRLAHALRWLRERAADIGRQREPPRGEDPIARLRRVFEERP